MKVPVRSLFALRKASTAVSAAEAIPLTAVLSSEFFDHIRHQIYGDSKKVEKVVVKVLAEDSEKPVLVNRNVSTPFHCFNHISKQFADDAVLVEVIPSVGGAYFSSVNEPIQDQSDIRKIGFDSIENLNLVNEAYWRSCSLVTAGFLKEALDVDVDFEFPRGSIQDGYFSVAVKGLDGNVFTPDELNTINRFGKTYIRESKPFEVISLPKTIAEESGINGDYLIRIGQQVFPTDGPVISSTQQIGRFTILRSKLAGRSGKKVIVGGVSIPSKQMTSSYSWSLIAKNANQKFSKNN
uniref:39S ribosomal protein L39, mitochondrial n=1 Tax=Caenorhabditis tropicalis TaxID=1561998 RepID=A0A1I7T7J8_9PELO